MMSIKQKIFIVAVCFLSSSLVLCAADVHVGDDSDLEIGVRVNERQPGDFVGPWAIGRPSRRGGYMPYQEVVSMDAAVFAQQAGENMARVRIAEESAVPVEHTVLQAQRQAQAILAQDAVLQSDEALREKAQREMKFQRAMRGTWGDAIRDISRYGFQQGLGMALSNVITRLIMRTPAILRDMQPKDEIEESQKNLAVHEENYVRMMNRNASVVQAQMDIVEKASKLFGEKEVLESKNVLRVLIQNQHNSTVALTNALYRERDMHTKRVENRLQLQSDDIAKNKVFELVDTLAKIEKAQEKAQLQADAIALNKVGDLVNVMVPVTKKFLTPPTASAKQ